MLENRGLDRNVRIPATAPVTIDASEYYGFDSLRVLSQDWTQPVLVKGLFKDAPALKLWNNSEYLIEKTFKNSNVSVVGNGTIAKHYDMICGDPELERTQPFSTYVPFTDAIERIKQGSPETIVFPPASRSKRIREKEVEEKWNKMVAEDLGLSRIGPVFEGEAKATVLTQMFLGGGVSLDGGESPLIGTGWHGDICNNFVVQISGRKKWLMVDTKYSNYMRPTMRTGKTAVVGGHISLETETMPYFPHHEFTVEPGDFLYNPEWYWHSIQNYPDSPYAFGMVSRQCHIGRNFRASKSFTGAVVVNHALAGIFDVEARMRLWSALTGASLMVPEKGVNVQNEAEVSTGYT